jgi:hypothetical protein
MDRLDYSWVQKEITNLEKAISFVGSWSMFAPTDEIYKKLSSGDQYDLQNVVNLMGKHLKLPIIPKAKYDWSLKIPLQATGQIKNPGSEKSQINIPFSIIGKTFAIGATLAHEISHQFLNLNDIFYPDLDKNEKLTDIVSIVLGFGKFVLNGLALEASGIDGLKIELGYIRTEIKLITYILTCKKYKISSSEIYSYLANDVVILLDEFASKNKKLVKRIAKELK